MQGGAPSPAGVMNPSLPQVAAVALGVALPSPATSVVTVVACTGGKVCAWDPAHLYYNCITPPADADAGTGDAGAGACPPGSDPSCMFPLMCP